MMPSPQRIPRLRLLNAAQRKDLGNRIAVKVRALECHYRKTIESEKEPAEVTRARQIVDRWEAERDAHIDSFVDALNADARQLTRNLLFDTVESALSQVEEFERRKAT